MSGHLLDECKITNGGVENLCRTSWSSDFQVNVAVDGGNVDFFDPLRGGIDNDAKATPLEPESLSEVSGDQPTKEWTSFRRILMQRFPVSKMVSLSS
ncbi:hypothetical protein L195_g053108, partial [Trifolium pratense]